MRGFVANEDGLMVARMKAAGCIVIGKSNTPEFGLGSHTFNPVFGTTLNAYDPRQVGRRLQRWRGGCGAGAAAAAGGRRFGLHGQPQPGGLGEHLWLQAQPGRVPMWPAQDVGISQRHRRPMGRSVRDLQRLLATQAGWSPNAPLSIAEGAYPEMAGGLFDVKSTRIAWLADLDGYLPMEPGILDRCAQGCGAWKAWAAA